MKRLDNISENDIATLNIPTGVPLLYKFDKDMKVIGCKNAIKPLRGLYLGNIEEIKGKIDAVANQTKKK